MNSGHSQFTYCTGSTDTQCNGYSGGDVTHKLKWRMDPRCFAAGASCNSGHGLVNTYDTAGRVTSQADQLNRVTTFDYTSIPAATKVTDPKGNVRVDYYTAGVKVAVTGGYGTSQAATMRYAYDLSTLVATTITDPNGNSTAITVDASGNVLTSTDPLGHETITTYNSLNEPLTVEDANQVAGNTNGATTTYTYDSRGNLLMVSRPLTGTSSTQVTTYKYQDPNHLGDVSPRWWTRTERRGPIGTTATATAIPAIDPLGNRSTYQYNADGFDHGVVHRQGCRGVSAGHERRWRVYEPWHVDSDAKWTAPRGRGVLVRAGS